ncbi:hypothetical protein RC74_13515 [Falsihalocynthiibacter arcticus]|uniref:Uncharacterized protein n=1 Tax=Falsihalocynthiibacter arcticus TaxID=1579316 RepID=A0A126V2P5_9RHOB|nr:hypothetical protein RC74_13515 [Falsihalocynthiibacter arcticus]
MLKACLGLKACAVGGFVVFQREEIPVWLNGSVTARPKAKPAKHPNLSSYITDKCLRLNCDVTKNASAPRSNFSVHLEQTARRTPVANCGFLTICPI